MRNAGSEAAFVLEARSVACVPCQLRIQGWGHVGDFADEVDVHSHISHWCAAPERPRLIPDDFGAAQEPN